MSLKQKLHIFPGRMAIEHHGPTWREATVVDVGAGTGLLSVMCGKFARQVPGVSVVEAPVGPWRFRLDRGGSKKWPRPAPFPPHDHHDHPTSIIRYLLFIIHHPLSIIP